MKQNLIKLKGQIDKYRIKVGDFNVPILAIKRTTCQNISKDRGELNNTINQQDLTVVYTALHHKTSAYTFFSSAQRAYTKRAHSLGYRASLNRFKRSEIIQNEFYDCNRIKLENTNRKTSDVYFRDARLL